MHPNTIALKDKIQADREEIIAHPLYGQINHPQKLSVFMEHHVFAVWDFMSLLKSLQIKLTCTSIPWVPVGLAENRFLINEIVTGEESDMDETGVRMSHFELYLKAMKQCGADDHSILEFIHHYFQSRDLEASLNLINAPDSVRQFVQFTFDVIATDKPHILAAVFTFGREDLIPDMFISIVRDMNHQWPDTISTFKYYLERHIEVDGDHHSLLALQMVENLCGQDAAKWKEAEYYVSKSLQMRKELWDGAMQQLMKSEKVIA
jgi:hypothetical protein